MIPPPINEPWLPLRLELRASDAGHVGTIQIGGSTMHVRGWRRLDHGVVVAEVQYPQDPAWQAALDAVTRRMAG